MLKLTAVLCLDIVSTLNVDFLIFNVEKQTGRGEERKERDTFKADYENSDPEKPNTGVFCEDGDYDTSLYTVDY